MTQGNLHFCMSELMQQQLMALSSQSACKDALRPLQGFNMHHTITSWQRVLIPLSAGRSVHVSARPTPQAP